MSKRAIPLRRWSRRIKRDRKPTQLLIRAGAGELTTHDPHLRFARSPQPPGNTCLVQIIGRHFHFDTVSDGQADPSLAHLATNRGEDSMLIIQLDTKHRSSQHRCDNTFHFNMFFFHLFLSKRPAEKRDIPQTESGRSEKESELAKPTQRGGISRKLSSL